MTQDVIEISEEFKSLIPPLSETEKEQLEANIVDEGCRDPLVTWNNMLIDGHNRYEICQRHGIKFSVVQKAFADKEEVKDWMDANQLGRRNLTPDAFRLLLGRRYNRTKKEQGGTGANQHEQNGQNAHSAKTSETLAEQHGVNEKTVRRAGQLAEAAEKLDIEKELTSGELKAPQKAIVEAARSLPENPTPEEVQEAKKHVHVAQNSGENEWYTPPEFIDAARLVMGSINLDPASSEIANQRVQAATIYTKEDNGLLKDWHGNVWLNPPYAQPLISQFSERITEQVDNGNVLQAIVLVNNATETRWFQVMLEEASAVCFPKGRIRYFTPEGEQGKTPLQGQAIIYFGSLPSKFKSVFQEFGTVLFVENNER